MKKIIVVFILLVASIAVGKAQYFVEVSFGASYDVEKHSASYDIINNHPSTLSFFIALIGMISANS